MKRKKIIYPKFESFSRARNERKILETKISEIYFIPTDGIYKGKIKLFLKQIGSYHPKEFEFGNTKDGYEQAISAHEAYMNEFLDEIENEFYED